MELRKKIISAIMVIFLSLGMVGCSGSGPITIDGKIDVVEAQIIQVAVGVAMASKPEMVKPVYDISGKLLEVPIDYLKNRIDVHNLPQGRYTISILLENRVLRGGFVRM